MKRGEVWWVDFEPSIGSETYKICPAVIISNDSANKHLARVVIVPITSNTARLYPAEALVTVDGKQGKAMADQITTADKSHLKSHLDTLSVKELTAIEEAVKIHLALPR